VRRRSTIRAPVSGTPNEVPDRSTAEDRKLEGRTVMTNDANTRGTNGFPETRPTADDVIGDAIGE